MNAERNHSSVRNSNLHSPAMAGAEAALPGPPNSPVVLKKRPVAQTSPTAERVRHHIRMRNVDVSQTASGNCLHIRRRFDHSRLRRSHLMPGIGRIVNSGAGATTVDGRSSSLRVSAIETVFDRAVAVSATVACTGNSDTMFGNSISSFTLICGGATIV